MQVHPVFAPQCVFRGTSEILGAIALYSNGRVDETE